MNLLLLLVRCYCKQGCSKENQGNGIRKCPCILNGVDCKPKKCRCVDCQNNKLVKRNARTGCRCATGCHHDEEKKRKSKCPCLKMGMSCKDCLCKDCKNPHGVRDISQDDAGNKPKQVRKGKSHTSYKKVRTEDYLATPPNITPCASLGQGSWVLDEIACLYVSAMWILQIHSSYDSEKIHELYHFFLSEEVISKEISLKTKTLKQVTEKLSMMRFVNE